MSAISVSVSCPFSATSRGGFLFRPRPGRCWCSVFFLCLVMFVFAPLPHCPQEPAIFVNMTWGSRAWPALEDSCCHRTGGSAALHSAGGPCRDDMDQKSLDQLSQLLWAKVAVGPTVTLWQLVLDFGVQMFDFRVGEQFVHFWLWG